MNSTNSRSARHGSAAELPLAYKDSAFILRQISARKGSLNSLISQLKHKSNIKLVYALVVKAMKNLKTIKQMMESTNIYNEIDFEPFLAEILVADLLYGKGLHHIQNVSQVQQILSHEKKLKKLFNKKNERNDKMENFIVRYIRVNLIKTNMKKVIAKLVKNGFQQIIYDKAETSFEEFKSLVKNQSEAEFLIDYDFPIDLLAFNISATKKLQQLKLFTETKILMQDKASLIAVECLNLSPGMTILDACCAPGMKTSAIASRLKNNGKIYAIDMSEQRLSEMKSIIDKSGVTCCEISCCDFTKVTPDEMGSIDVILLDPSCSGSGINKRLEYNKDIHEDKARLYKLASFQTRMLCHAMSFNAKRIIYCTCSLSLIENENVVKSALRESEFAHNYTVVNALPNWTTRGVGDYEFAHKCIRSDSHSSFTNGFFVCVLEKNDSIL